MNAEENKNNDQTENTDKKPEITAKSSDKSGKRKKFTPIRTGVLTSNQRRMLTEWLLDDDKVVRLGTTRQLAKYGGTTASNVWRWRKKASADQTQDFAWVNEVRYGGVEQLIAAYNKDLEAMVEHRRRLLEEKHIERTVTETVAKATKKGRRGAVDRETKEKIAEAIAQATADISRGQ